jgi:hypothetical protein
VHYRTVDDAADEDEGAEDKPHGKNPHDPHRQLFFETPCQQRHIARIALDSAGKSLGGVVG